MSAEYTCGVTAADGTCCGLMLGHAAKHEFTIPPPDEYFEDDDVVQMQNERITMADEVVETKKPRKLRAVGGTQAADTKHTLTIHFTEPEDIQLYALLEQNAKADFRRPLPQYVLLALHTAFKDQLTPTQEV